MKSGKRRGRIEVELSPDEVNLQRLPVLWKVRRELNGAPQPSIGQGQTIRIVLDTPDKDSRRGRFNAQRSA